MSYPPQSGGPGDGVVIPVSSLPTHEGAEIARLTRALADSAELALAGAARVAEVKAERDAARADAERRLDALIAIRAEREALIAEMADLRSQSTANSTMATRTIERRTAQRDEARDQLRLVTGERNKFSGALDCMHAQQIRTESERDEAQIEVTRLRSLIDGVDCALGRYRSTGDYIPLLDAAERAVNERLLP
jgi:chromosome segregation ATPase